MTEGLPWSVKGIEPDLRNDASRAAKAAGVTLGQWLNGIIRDTLVDIQAASPFNSVQNPAGVSAVPPIPHQEMASPPMPPAQQPYPYAPPPPQNYAPPPYGHPQGYAPQPYAAPPAPYAPPAYAGPPYAQPYAPPPPPWYDPYAMAPRGIPQPAAQEPPPQVQDDRLASVLTALSGIVDRAQAAPQPLQTAPPAPAPAPVDTGLHDQLSALMERLASLESSIATRQEARSEAARPEPKQVGDSLFDARSMETRLGDALSAIGGTERPLQNGVRPPPARSVIRPRVNLVRGGGAALAVADIAARQRDLDANAAPKALTAQETRAEQHRAEENRALEQIRRSIAALADQVRDTKLDQAHAPQTDLRSELKELQQAVQELAPRRIVASVNESIRGLASKIEQTRQSGAAENQLAPIERMLGELRASIEQPRDPKGLETVGAALAHLARRVEEIAQRPVAPGVQPGEMQRQFAEIRAILAEAQTQSSIPRIDAQLNQLSQKLDDLGQRPGSGHALSQVAVALDQIRDEVERFNPDRVMALIDERTAGLGGRIEELASRLNGAQTGADNKIHLDSLSRQIERMTKALGQRENTPDLSHLSAAIEDMRQTLASRPTPVDLSGVERRIEEMRQTISNRPVSADLSGLERRMDEMRQAVSSRPATADLSSVEQRIAEVHTLLERKIPTQPDVRGLEMILRQLAERIETVRAPGASESSLDALQVQIMALAERLDHAGTSAPGLAGLERTVHDLYRAVGEMRDSTAHAAQSAVRDALALAPAGGVDPVAAEGLMLIKRDLTEMKNAQNSAESRSRETLQSVGSTLEKIVSRLASLEMELQAPRAQAHPHPVAAAQDGRPPPQLARAPEPVAPPPPRAPVVKASDRPAAMAQPIVADPAGDLPLEPGIGRAGTAASAQEASLDPRSNFIAAARRAAQSAATQTSAALSDMDRKPGRGGKLQGNAAGKLDGVKSVFAARRKSILIGLAIAIFAIGGLITVGRLMSASEPSAQAGAPAEATQNSALDRRTSAARQLEPELTARMQKAPAQALAQTQDGAEAQDNTVVGSITDRAAPVTPQAVIAPPLLPVKPPPSQPVDVASLLKQMPFAGPERLKQAAANGNLPAIYEIGARYADGRGVQADLKAAARWLEHAASQGYAPAQYRFGSFNREGLGVEQDPKTAFVWFMRAAEQGHVLAMHNLAVLYAEGVTGSPDYSAAAAWFRNAAEHGVKDSQFNIAILHVRGLGVTQDMIEAYKWFAVAAQQGDADAIKRRDELAGRLSSDKLAEAKQRAEDFRAKKPDMRANEVIAPEGGWDQSQKPAAQSKKTRV